YVSAINPWSLFNFLLLALGVPLLVGQKPVLWAHGLLTGDRTPSSPVLRILVPLEEQEVDLRRPVYGSVVPPVPVQVLVHSPDGQWYLQKTPSVDGSEWTTSCQFGNENSPPGGKYGIVAISGSKIRERAIAALPKDVARSNVVHVFRR